jgi:hypothetical protein
MTTFKMLHHAAHVPTTGSKSFVALIALQFLQVISLVSGNCAVGMR